MPPSRPAPGCCAAWLAAQWFPPGGSAAHAHTAAPAAIACCESRLAPRNPDTPAEASAQREDSQLVSYHRRGGKNCMYILQLLGSI